MTIPFEPTFFGTPINIHLILEYMAFFIGYRYYAWLRKNTLDKISTQNRLSIILGAILGAFLGSRLSGYFENPILTFSTKTIIDLFNTKSIMGGMFGGLLGVEIAKKIIGEKHSSGDLFVFPIILGIIIGRIGCFLMGIKEFTYGIKTNFITGMDLGDGYLRHPIALYEIVFLLLLFIFLKKIKKYLQKENGLLFKLFMISYFGFRFCIEFIKPNVFYVLYLSSIQWLCIICWTYYLPTLKKLIKNAN
ncbi:Prolipoprotein diacylglyceryltransferase [Tenacibaculum sp. MAR_2009_124]|uniref:prolipoprotein diacylglyceryl transferase family protein n=1 Tax=Tenacibaculum sp. MAR_2009_124 TaxID=1250059 RepID=UPI000897B1E5|nr:prolipoprotein diacylglyceryl transferase family protein [Tenacibaculum sp. MAR_2009_124]SEB84877.1 Prolipoprotein diacylglyceryltransferase [Tenacibaculum sp. MAR_2009_124]